MSSLSSGNVERAGRVVNRAAVALAAAGLLAGCLPDSGSGAGATDPVGDTAGATPGVSSGVECAGAGAAAADARICFTTPREGAVGVVLLPLISVKFNVDVDEASLRLASAGGEVFEPGAADYSSDRRLAQWQQSSALTPGETYAATVEYGHGGSADHFSWEFSAADGLVLTAQPRHGQVTLSWNAGDYGSDTEFTVCRAEEAPEAAGFDNCATLEGGHLESGAVSPHTVDGLDDETRYWFWLEADPGGGGEPLYSSVVAAAPGDGVRSVPTLNDTGIDWCADGEANHHVDGTAEEKGAMCDELADADQGEEYYPGQDGHHGRDAAARDGELEKTGGGAAGFDFTRICNSGDEEGVGVCPDGLTGQNLGDAPEQWGCTRDNVTGLIWEVKVDDGDHLRHYRHSYSWYDPNPYTNGGHPGAYDGGGACALNDAPCNTAAYVAAVNAERLCGHDDWRVPSRMELHTLTHQGRPELADDDNYYPPVDEAYFPHVAPLNHWTASPLAESSERAWAVLMQHGSDVTLFSYKEEGYRLLLVRGGE